MLPGGSVEAHMALDPDANAGALDELEAGMSVEELPPLAAAPPAPQQAAEVEAAEARDIAEGEQMYLISQRWWADWCAHTQFRQQQQPAAATPSDDGPAAASASAAAGGTPPAAAASPGTIDNSDIVSCPGLTSRLRDNLEEGRHFVIVTAQSWQLLQGWYGGGPAITRTAVMQGLAPHTKRPRVMLYPMRLEVRWGGKPNEIKTVEAEKNETVSSLKARACAAFGVDPASVDIYDFFHNAKYECLEGPKLELSLDAARILDEQPILLDDKANPLPDDKNSSPTFSYASGRPARMSSLQDDSTVQRANGRPGLVGLQNLGNTCFMNSSLQCLMHAVPIMSVFLSGAFEADINTTNPLGLKGQLATALGNLIGNVWKPDVGSVVPRAFKAKIAAFAPQFSGYQQHDSQEFLGFLLDGLHEDVNRIAEKPYIEEPNSEGMRDEELAALAWSNYRARNDSAIVDHFQGLYKSTLVCPGCAYSSVKFDPFMYLSLPLPESRVRQLTAILLHADGAAPPREYGLEVPQTGTLADLYASLAHLAGLPPLVAPERQMVAAKLRQHSGLGGGLSLHEDARARISELGRDDRSEVLLVYYYADPEDGPGGRGGSNKRVLVYNRRAGRRGTDGRFSAPLLLWLPPEQTYDPALHVARAAPSAGQIAWAEAAAASGSAGRQLGGGDVEYALRADAPLHAHVRRMLRPFLAPPSLRQQPALQHADGDAEATQEAAGEQDAPAAAAATQQQPQQQQPAGSGGPADVSMAAASAPLRGSPAISGSPEHGATSQPASRAPWSSDGGAAADVTNNRAASEAGGDNNSTWGSHGSDAAPSDVDMPDLQDLDDDDPAAAAAAAAPDRSGGGGKAAAGAEQQQQQRGSSVAGCPAAPAAAGGVDMDDGEAEAQAAIEAEMAGDGAAAAAAGHDSAGLMLGGSGVPVAPLDMWAAEPQATSEQAAAAAQEVAAGDAAAACAQQAPPLQLKLAKDSGESSHVVSWMANHFHPHVHHQTFILDWDYEAATRTSHAEYMAAAAAEGGSSAGADAGQQQQQQEPGDAPQEQQLEQQPATFWLPDQTDDTPPLQDNAQHEVIGNYTVTPMQAPQQDASVAPIRAARSDPRGKVVSLDACVEAFLQPEQLSESDEWYCPKCKTHVQADKKLDLWALPEVLVVHLKRFSYTRWNRDKLDTQVVFPLDGLDLSRYVLPSAPVGAPPLYDCFAVSNHYGGLGGGHYTASAQMPDDKKWYLFDDSRVEDLAPEAVQSKAAYLLFYRRRAQAAADPPDLVPRLLEQRRAYAARKEEEAAAAAAAAEQAREAAARAAAGCGVAGAAAAAAAAAGDGGGPDVQPMDTGAAGAVSDAAPPAAAATPPPPPPPPPPALALGGGGLLVSPELPSPTPAALAGGRSGTSGRRLAAGRPGDSSTTSGSAPAAAGQDDGDSSDGSSSRPRGRQQAVEAAAAADAVDSWGPLQQQQQPRSARQSDQDLDDADMADRDV